jgi:putative membrane protein
MDEREEGTRTIDRDAIFAIGRPHPNLFKYYVISALLAGPIFPILLVVLYFRYHTLRYRFDGEGIAMRWGILFRREITLTYARIQDIHISSNLVERWLGLARIQIQTASGSSKAEMTLEGLLEFEAVRDFLYANMRGIKSGEARPESPAPEDGTAPPGENPGLADILRDVASELRGIRAILESGARRDR